LFGLTAMVDFRPLPARAQQPLASQPFDRWILPDGFVKAEFHRLPDGFLLRFTDEADFEILPATSAVTGWPVPDTAPDHFRSLFDNAVLPLIGDHAGGLFLHGSAVTIDGRAAAFLGQSGDGKTTLAGAFAKAGYPFLTEDVIELVPDDDGYQLQPKPSGLRLYADSAAFLTGAEHIDADSDAKFDVADAMRLPFRNEPAPLAAIFVLGADHEAPLGITRLTENRAAQALMPHSFVLDVEDKNRLRGHFSRIVGLCCNTPCYALDYVRDYDELPRVVAAITTEINQVGALND
jgi:hypothetical protein